MRIHVQTSRTIQTVGSVMEIWPTGNYIEHMPKGTPQQRIGQHWQNTGNHLRKALKGYEKLSHEE
ncbi:hypothetical protein [Halomonas sp. 328]|uniref:hypothetical protein n=1 Tax=Halomonas sp. 328 TaxID=2776704 RepID=UPI0018A7B5AF|nr:hypothetical protein [Halomonas sp. 328]MBF8222754.1 hypothetical protein [Halomonas sp. 328]